MKIAVAIEDSIHITPQTGKCQQFWIYNVENNTIISKEMLRLPQEQTFHDISPEVTHPLTGIQVLIGGSIGKGLLRRLETMGIQGVITPETNPEQAITAYLAGTLITGDPNDHQHQEAAVADCKYHN